MILAIRIEWFGWPALAVALAGVACLLPCPPAAAKSPGTIYCFGDVCHRVKTLEETAAAQHQPMQLVASYYDDCGRDRFNPCGLTSSGEVFRADLSHHAASPIYPDGTRLLVWSPTSHMAAVIRVNNAGPYFSNRLLDVSRALAERMGFIKRGVARLEVMVLSAPTRAEARHVAFRQYARVPGIIGIHKSLDHALAAWQAKPDATDPPAPAPEIVTSALRPIEAPQPVADAPIVRIGMRASAGFGSRGPGGVTLLPVRLRRAPLLQARSARGASAP